MTDEQAKEMIEQLKIVVDYMKGLHKEMREVKVRVSEMSK